MSNGKVEQDRPKPKDRWDKADVILKFVGGLLTAAVIGGLGWWGSGVLENQRISDAKTRLYTELMSKREESENSLRKDMFVKIIDSFLKTDQIKEKQDLEPKVLELELLAYNFHESLNLKPLFIHLRKQIGVSNQKDGKDYLERMEKVAREIIDKQMLVLEEATGARGKRELDIDLSGVPQMGKPKDETLEPLHLKDFDLELVDANNRLINRNIEISVLEADPKRKEIKVRVEIRTSLGKAQSEESEADSTSSNSTAKFIQPINRELSVGPFDFPFIDNIRLSNDQRLALVLKDFSEEQKPVITVVLFPGSHASLREKPFFQEIIQKLQLGGK
jgi:hypothetical protein